MAEKEIFEEIMKRADALAPELVKLRRDFHKYPELGWMEMRTTSIVASCLKESGCDQVLVGKEVCKAEARMGVPSEALLEDHYDEICDEIWYVYVEEETRIRRLQSSRGYTPEKTRAVLKNQKSDEEFRRFCQFMIDNSSDNVENTYKQIDRGLMTHGFL